MKKRIYSLLALGALAVLGSCKKDYLDINQNPNSPTSSTPQLVLNNALSVTAGGSIGNATVGGTTTTLNRNEIGSFWAGYWSPSGSVSGFTQEKSYNITANFRTGIWTGTYDNIKDYDYVEDRANELGYTNIRGIARIMKALNFQFLVDAYGNVPYTEAQQGFDIIRPKYDDAQAIYEDLIKKIDEGIADLKVPKSAENPNPGSSDIYFGGNMTKWARFANTIKLRILLRQAYVPGKESYIQSEIAKIVTEGSGFIGAGENITVNPGYLKTDGKQNPFWDTYGFTAAGTASASHDFYTVSDFSVKLLQSLGDARLTKIAAPVSGVYKGVPFGEGGDVYIYSKVSGFGPGVLKSFDQPMIVMTAAESLFLQAEAVQRGWLAGDAQGLFEQGITESFKLFDVTDEDKTPEEVAEEYYAPEDEMTLWDESADKIRAIITQKWIAMHSINGFEAWCEFRRTGYPSVPLSTRASVSKQPVRLLYPTQEVSTNNENVVAQGSIDAFESKIFWDKN